MIASKIVEPCPSTETSEEHLRMHDAPPRTDAIDNTPAPSTGPSRRTIVTGAAWAVPAIVAVTATPAAAAASGPSVTPTTPNMQVTAGEGQQYVTATVLDAAGSPLSGQAVSFTGSGTATFSPSSATTDSYGRAYSVLMTDTWLTPGSTVTVTAISNGVIGTAALSVIGANAAIYGRDQTGLCYPNPNGPTDYSTAQQLQRVFPSPIKALASGSNSHSYALALLQDGSVWSTGLNDYGQLADGTTTDRKTWARIPSLTGVTQIVAASSAAYALLADGTIRAWGENSNGQLGNGNYSSSSVPVTVQGITNATQIAGSYVSAYALLADGTVRAWGSNTTSQLGIGADPTTTTSSNTPLPVSGISSAVQIAGQNYGAYARLSDGTIRAWGQNNVGQLGDGTKVNRNAPVTVQGISTATDVAASQLTAYAVLSDGTVRSWGSNNSGQLGVSTPNMTSTPLAVQNITTATRVVCGYRSALVQLSDGTMRSWGANGQGQLGDGTKTGTSTPVVAQNTIGATTMMMGNYDSLTLFLIR